MNHAAKVGFGLRGLIGRRGLSSTLPIYTKMPLSTYREGVGKEVPSDDVMKDTKKADEAVKSAGQTIYGKAKDEGEQGYEHRGERSGPLMEEAKKAGDKVKHAGETVYERAKEAASAGIHKAKEAGEAVKETVSAGFDKLKNAGKDVGQDVKKAAKSAKENVGGHSTEDNSHLSGKHVDQLKKKAQNQS